MIKCITAEPLRYPIAYKVTSGSYLRELADKYQFGPLISEENLIRALSPAEKGEIAPEFFSPRFLDEIVYGEGGILPEDSVCFKGHVYLLVDDRSFSSCANFAYACKQGRWATIVGTWLGGERGSAPAIAILPNSRMVINFPVGFGPNPDLTANEEFRTVADVLVEDYDAFVKGYAALAAGELHSLDPEYDPVLGACFELIRNQTR